MPLRQCATTGCGQSRTAFACASTSAIVIISVLTGNIAVFEAEPFGFGAHLRVAGLIRRLTVWSIVDHRAKALARQIGNIIAVGLRRHEEFLGHLDRRI